MTASFVLFGFDLEFHPTLLNIENALGGITLGEDFVVFWALRNSLLPRPPWQERIGDRRKALPFVSLVELASELTGLPQLQSEIFV